MLRVGLLFSALGFTALASVIYLKEMVNRNTWDTEQHSRIRNSNSIIVVKTDDESSCMINVRGAQILSNCTFSAYLESNKRSDCSRESELNPPVAAINKEMMPDQDPRFSILMGVFTRADLYERRHFLRMVYGIQSTPLARIDTKFVICSLYKEDQRILVPLEIMRYNDIIILDCEENMNNGKTYTYFSSLPAMGLRYDYVMKLDDDIYFRYDKLAESLRPLPREDTYYGFLISCESHPAVNRLCVRAIGRANQNSFREFMAGMGYALSWDLVEWIQRSPIAKNKSEGTEDVMVGIWLNEGKKAKNRFNAEHGMYDSPSSNGGAPRDFTPDTIAVHQLKDREMWLEVLKYFNVTSADNHLP